MLTLAVEREDMERDPRAIRVYGWAELRDALKACAGYARWHVAAALTGDEVAQLVPVLAPELRSDDSAGYPRLVGGMLLEVHEVADIVPNVRQQTGVDGLWRRGRHNWLSIVAATQRPQDTIPVVFSQSHILIAFPTDSDLELRRWRVSFSRDVAARIQRLEQYHCLWIDRRARRAYHLGPEYQVLEEIPLHQVPPD